jgi:hypothetical protein
LRDVVDQVTHYVSSLETRTRYLDFGVPGPWSAWKTGGSTTYSLRSRMRARSEITTSDHFKPTPYTAWDYNMFPARGASRTYQIYESPRWTREVQQRRSIWFPSVTSSLYVGIGTQGGLVIPLGIRVRDLSENQVLGELRDQKVNFAQTMGELVLGGHLMAAQVHSVWKAFQAARRGRFYDVRRHLRRGWELSSGRRPRWSFQTVSRAEAVRREFGLWPTNLAEAAGNSWLAWKFGWAPLLQDITNTRAAILQYLSAEESYAEVEATVVRPLSFTNSLIDVRYDGSAEAGCTHKLWFRIEDSELAGLNQLGLIDPLSLSWELTGLSFVIDWFVGVSDFLSGLSAPLGLKFVTGYRTEFTRSNFTYSPKQWDGDSPGRVNSFAFERMRLTSFPQPSVVTNLGLNREQMLTLGVLFRPR